MEEGLHKLKSWATSSLLQAASPTAELLCAGLQALEEMYDCVEELPRLPHTQRALARQQHEKWVAVELDSSVRLLDICGTTKDAISSMKSALRTRRSVDSTVEGQIRALVHSTKKAHKDSCKCLRTLKQMEARPLAYPTADADRDRWLALRALKDLREITIIIFRCISSFVSTAKPRRWFQSSRTSEGEQITSELKTLEASLRSIQGERSWKDAGLEKKVEEAQRQLQGLEVVMSSLERGLESLFKRQVQNRASLFKHLLPILVAVSFKSSHQHPNFIV